MIKKRLCLRGTSKLITPAVYTGIIAILVLLPLFVESPYWIHIFILVFTYIICTSSLRFITTSGQTPLAHAAFMGIGAYVAGMASRWLHWSPWFTIPLGAIAAMAIGMLIGYPFSRLRTIYYALVSLFFGGGIIQVILAFSRWTGGQVGLADIQLLFAVGTSKVPYYYFFLGLTLLCLLAIYRFEFCRIGISLKAISQSYLVASSVGINEARYRIIALAVGCFFVGLAGASYAHYAGALSYTSFDLLSTLWLFIYVLIGGIGSFVGPIIGTAILIIVPELFRGLKEFVPFISAAILLIVIFVMPKGLVGLPQIIKSWFSESMKNKRRVTHAS